MSILIHKDTEMLMIGITGKQGRIHCQRTLESGTKLLAGVAPGNSASQGLGILPNSHRTSYL